MAGFRRSPVLCPAWGLDLNLPFRWVSGPQQSQPLLSTDGDYRSLATIACETGTPSLCPLRRGGQLSCSKVKYLTEVIREVKAGSETRAVWPLSHSAALFPYTQTQTHSPNPTPRQHPESVPGIEPHRTAVAEGNLTLLPSLRS